MSPSAPSSHGDWAVVLEASQIYEAELAALRLREAGLEARVIDQSYRQEPVPSVRGLAVVRILVPAGRAEEARRILAEGTELAEGADPSGGTDDAGGDER